MSGVDTSKLKDMISQAESVLEELKTKQKHKSKQKRILDALEKAYAILNKKLYTQKEVDYSTRIVWKSMQDFKPVIMWILLAIVLLFVFTFTGTYVFNYVKNNINGKNSINKMTNESSKLVTISYDESNVVDLKDMMSQKDEEGLLNQRQKFTIKNDSSKLPKNLDYIINYEITINEIKSDINKKYIKYKVDYEDEAGTFITTSISNLADLKKNKKGELILLEGTQKKDATTHFEVTFWIDYDTPNSEQDKSYIFSFDVHTTIDAK
jgi:hypothetical protein